MEHDKRLKVIGYKIHGGEYNLASLFKRTIQEAFTRHPTSTMEDIATLLGISARTLHRVCGEWNIERPKITARARKRKQELAKMGFSINHINAQT